MKSSLFIGLATCLMFCSCTPVKTVDLGYGYERVMKQSKSDSSFESNPYHAYLRYRGKLLGEVGYVSISPSGKYALFESDGELMVFSSGPRRFVQVTDGAFSVPGSVEWDEPNDVVVIY